MIAWPTHTEPVPDVAPAALPVEALPHDSRLEPADETIAEVQSLVCASRQIDREMPAADLVVGMSAALRQLIESPSPGYAVALAALALRYREEHC